MTTTSNAENSPSATIPPSNAELNIETILMSGGGYRATAFHLGLLRWLYEHRRKDANSSMLEDVKRVVGISGGSITAAHFAKESTRYCKSFSDACKELVSFLCSTNIRDKVLKKNADAVSEFETLFPPKDGNFSTGPTGTEAIELEILGTRLDSGNCVIFRRAEIEEQRPVKESDGSTTLESESVAWDPDVRKAIQASAAFPPILPPFQISPESIVAQRNSSLGRLLNAQVADGGIRDNLGTSYALTQDWGRIASRILVSDAGRLFDEIPENPNASELARWAYRLFRTTEIQMKRIADLDEINVRGVPTISLRFANTVQTDNRDELAWKKGMSRGAAIAAASIPTDLTPLNQSQVFALLRLAYEACDSFFEEHHPGAVVPIEVGDKFWEKNWPSDISDPQRYDQLEAKIKAGNQAYSFTFWNTIPSIPNANWAMTWIVVVLVVLVIVGFGLGYLFGIKSGNSVGDQEPQTASIEAKFEITLNKQPPRAGKLSVVDDFREPPDDHFTVQPLPQRDESVPLRKLGPHKFNLEMLAIGKPATLAPMDVSVPWEFEEYSLIQEIATRPTTIRLAFTDQNRVRNVRPVKEVP